MQQIDNVMKIGAVRMKKEKLIEILRQNLTKHNEIFKAAVEGYWVEAEEVLKTKLASVQAKAVICEKTEFRDLGVAYPENHAEDYEEIILSLELSVHDEVELNQNQFKAYIQNKW